MDVIQFESIGTIKDGEVFEWNVPGWILNHRYCTKRSELFTLSRMPDFKFCLTLRPYTDASSKSVSFNLQLHQIRVFNCGSDTKTETFENAVHEMDVRFILFKSDAVYKWSGIMKLQDNRLIANFPDVATYDSLTIQCAMVSAVALSKPDASRDSMIPDSSADTGLGHDLSALLDSGNLSDVTVCVGKKEFNVHRCILAARSSVFAAMFRHDVKENRESRILIADCSSDVIQQLLRYLYTDETEELTTQQSLSLLSAADKYAIADLQKKCSLYLRKNLEVEFVIHALIAADLHQDEDLKEVAIRVFLDNAVSVMNSEEWLSCMINHTRLANTMLMRLAEKSSKQGSSQ